MKRSLCLFMCVVMMFGLLLGCSNPEIDSSPETTPTTGFTIDCNRLVDVSGKEARTAVLTDGTLELASQLPEAAWNNLPKWNGVTIPNLQQYECIYDGEPQVFSYEDMKKISELGFNFVRVPLDTRLFFDLEAPNKVHLNKLINLDKLISWGAEFGTHICLDVHNSFGFYTNDISARDTMWENPEEQELFLVFWEMLAERYKDVPSNLLSFNLMNEPNGITEAQYVDLMRRAMKQIRTYTPDRLIFVDMMDTAKEPLYSLVEDQVAQAFHFYEPTALTHTTIHDNFDFGGGYPVFSGKGFISQHVGPAEFVIEGNFPAGTKISFIVDQVHLGGTLSLTADGKEIFSNEYDFDAVGEDGCTYIQEEGTGGEYRGYDNTFDAVLPEAASVLRLSVTGDIYWFNLKAMVIHAGEKGYMFEQNHDSLPAGKKIEYIPNPHIIISEDGTITDEGDILFKVIDASYINDRFAKYAAFSKETGVAVMLQEFGVIFAADYGMTLQYLNDLLDAANANGLNWCGWDYFGPFSFYLVSEDRRREGATYEEFSNGFIATEMLEVYQNHLSQ